MKSEFKVLDFLKEFQIWLLVDGDMYLDKDDIQELILITGDLIEQLDDRAPNEEEE